MKKTLDDRLRFDVIITSTIKYLAYHEKKKGTKLKTEIFKRDIERLR